MVKIFFVNAFDQLKTIKKQRMMNRRHSWLPALPASLTAYINKNIKMFDIFVLECIITVELYTCSVRTKLEFLYWKLAHTSKFFIIHVQGM